MTSFTRRQSARSAPHCVHGLQGFKRMLKQTGFETLSARMLVWNERVEKGKNSRSLTLRYGMSGNEKRSVRVVCKFSHRRIIAMDADSEVWRPNGVVKMS